MNIVLGVTGSIAAYKAADITSQLVKLGHLVHVVMTAEAQKFVTPLTLQTLSKNPVIADLWDERLGWQPGHIELADNADLLLIAPATAHVLAELAHGLAAHALCAIALALPPTCPVLIAPAMNGKMWLHPATQSNATTLRSRGARFIGPEEGMLACGYEGVGRLWPADHIVMEVAKILREMRGEIESGEQELSGR